MAQRLLYKAVQKTTKQEAGITKVDLEKDGKVIELGTVQNRKGSKTFSAFLLDGTMLGNDYSTKKQAGGALKKHFDAGGKMPEPTPETEPTKGEIIKKVAKETGIEVKELPVTKANLATVKGMPRPSALDPKPQAPIPASNWSPPREADGSVDFSFNPDDPLEIPNWLKRTTPKQRLEAALKKDDLKAA